MNILTGLKTGSTIVAGLTVKLLEIGVWGSINQHAQSRFRDKTSAFNREVGDGVKHVSHQVAPKLKVITRK